MLNNYFKPHSNMNNIMDASDNETDGREDLPPEVWLAIFGFLDVKDLMKCQLACKRWYALTEQDLRVKEYVEGWRQRNLKSLKEENEERLNAKKLKRQKKVWLAKDTYNCCTLATFSCVRCVFFTAVCPCFCPCFTSSCITLCGCAFDQFTIYSSSRFHDYPSR